jgi:hypothetical protein
VNRRRCLLAAVGLTTLNYRAFAGAAKSPLVGELKLLGDERFQIGRIVVDKRARRFVVPGRVHVVGKPLEYLAASPGGLKGYESLLEVDATGTEFNLACILLGLERDAKQVRFRQFSQAPLVGPRVAIHVAWQEGGRRRQIGAAEALLNPESGLEPAAVEWIYTGSSASKDDGLFAADATGTLVGFVHDANSVVESVLGLGIGAYGSIRGSAALPAIGSAIEMIVEVAPT